MYRTKRKEGKALQYTGHNILELEKKFPSLTVRLLKSKTTWDGGVYSDIRVEDKDGRKEDLIIEDWLMERDGDWFIIPMCEFEDYWEEV